jgi:hypothetical protein
MAKGKISGKSRGSDESRLHIRADEKRLARYELAKQSENFRTLTDWVLKTLDDRCDDLGVPKD